METVITGRWILVEGKVRGDAVDTRIEDLVATHLQRVGADSTGWDTLYHDPDDGRLWEYTYPHSEMHGGGPPQLQVIDAAAARRKYGLWKEDLEKNTP